MIRDEARLESLETRHYSRRDAYSVAEARRLSTAIRRAY